MTSPQKPDSPAPISPAVPLPASVANPSPTKDQPAKEQQPVSKIPDAPPSIRSEGKSDGSISIRERPDLLLSIDPENATFLPTGGQSEHMLVNLGKLRVVVKVRCSDNALFRVNPVYMFIESGQCCNVIVSRLPGPPKADKLVFHYLPTKETGADVNVTGKKVFEKSTSKPEMLKLTINCISRDEVPRVGPTTPPK